MKARIRCSLLASVLLAHSLLVLAGCGADPLRENALLAVERGLRWMESHAIEDPQAPLAERGMESWSFSLVSRLHPVEEVRRRAGDLATHGLQGLEPEIEPNVVSLSWWSLLLRNMDAHGVDSGLHRAALEAIDVDGVLAEMNPTTALWTAGLLRHAGVADVEPTVEGTMLADGAQLGIEGYRPNLRDAYRLYHELAPATDLGRQPPSSTFSRQQLEFARQATPLLLDLMRSERETDAAAEVLIAASLLGMRDETFYRDGIAWLIEQQREDGTYRNEAEERRAAGRHPPEPRHAVLVSTWALLESLRD